MVIFGVSMFICRWAVTNSSLTLSEVVFLQGANVLVEVNKSTPEMFHFYAHFQPSIGFQMNCWFKAVWLLGMFSACVMGKLAL